MRALHKTQHARTREQPKLWRRAGTCYQPSPDTDTSCLRCEAYSVTPLQRFFPKLNYYYSSFQYWAAAAPSSSVVSSYKRFTQSRVIPSKNLHRVISLYYFIRHIKNKGKNWHWATTFIHISLRGTTGTVTQEGRSPYTLRAWLPDQRMFNDSVNNLVAYTFRWRNTEAAVEKNKVSWRAE